jgi:chromosome segregation ATPase
MITALHLVLAFLFMGTFASVVLWLVSGVLQDMNKPLRAKVAGKSAELEQFNAALRDAVALLENRASADDVQSITRELEEILKLGAEENSFLQKIEEEVAELQKLVHAHEKQQAKMRQSKVEATALVEEIRARKDQLDAEALRMQNELHSTKNQIESLLSEVELTAEQRQSLEEVSAALTNTMARLQELSDLYKTASDRFMSLENQYVELEKEYQKIIEMELGETLPPSPPA